MKNNKQKLYFLNYLMKFFLSLSGMNFLLPCISVQTKAVIFPISNMQWKRINAVKDESIVQNIFIVSCIYHTFLGFIIFTFVVIVKESGAVPLPSLLSLLTDRLGHFFETFRKYLEEERLCIYLWKYIF